jgi:hypothetical protein
VLIGENVQAVVGEPRTLYCLRRSVGVDFGVPATTFNAVFFTLREATAPEPPNDKV